MQSHHPLLGTAALEELPTSINNNRHKASSTGTPRRRPLSYPLRLVRSSSRADADAGGASRNHTTASSLFPLAFSSTFCFRLLPPVSHSERRTMTTPFHFILAKSWACLNRAQWPPYFF